MIYLLGLALLALAAYTLGRLDGVRAGRRQALDGMIRYIEQLRDNKRAAAAGDD